MFLPILFGGIFAIVHTTFTEVYFLPLNLFLFIYFFCKACNSRDELVVNAVHKLAPMYYYIHLGNLNIEPGGNFSDTSMTAKIST